MKRKPWPNQVLLQERSDQHVTREELARRTGISRKTLWLHETKGSRIRLGNAGVIATALGKRVSELFHPELVIG